MRPTAGKVLSSHAVTDNIKGTANKIFARPSKEFFKTRFRRGTIFVPVQNRSHKTASVVFYTQPRRTERFFMFIQNLTAEHFRNIALQNVSFCKGLNILYGENGAGKTNLLEAVYLFAICKSHRTAKDADFISYGAPFAHLSLLFRSDFDRKETDLFRKAEIRYFPDGKKQLQYEGVSVGKVSEFIGNFRAVLFTPDHLALIKGAPEERRKFCDMALAQIRPGYIRYLNDYAKILGQRNALLKSFREKGTGDRALLSVYSEALSEKGAVIIRQRISFCRYLQELSRKYYKEISGDSERLFIRYYGSVKDSDPEKDLSEKEIADSLCALYSKNVDSEIFRGATKYGPHKDDFLFFMGKTPPVLKNDSSFNTEDESEKIKEQMTEFSARTFASQGQQRSTVLALKLSEGEIIRNLSGEEPVYLFDDVLSELDIRRRERFLSIFGEKQVLLTCCDEEAIKTLSLQNFAVQKISVHNGMYTVKGE